MFKKLKINDNINVRNESDRYAIFNPVTRAIHFISQEAYYFVELASFMPFDQIIEQVSKDNISEDTKKFKEELKEFYKELLENKVLHIVE